MNNRKLNMVITLIGYRGSGKSTIAGPLATRLGWPWIDADAELESRQEQSIQEIFATRGEVYFRALERTIMSELLGRNRLVIAAGGGAIMNPETREQMKSAGPVIWLVASVDTIEQRIREDATSSQRRPDLTATGGRSEIARLLSEREPLYQECAAFSFQTDDALPGATVDQLMKSIVPLLMRET